MEVSYVETRQKEARLASIAIKKAQGKLWRRHECHQLFCGGLTYISGNALKSCFWGLLVWWCIQAHASYDNCFHRLD